MTSITNNILSLLSLISIFFSYSTAHKTILSLSQTATTTQFSDPWQRLNHLATSSITRAKHLKYPKTNTSTIKVPLYPRGYGGYSVSLRFGTPPQDLSFVMDTGSSLVWFPCTKRYSCRSCNFANVNEIKVFVPKSSSSTKIIGCKNPKCGWLFPNVECKQCDKTVKAKACNQSCPPYMIQYGSGSTTGLLLSETLVFPEKSVPNFVAGCSVFSTSQPSGIAGFGRGQESLPAQLGLKRFSYCLVSHRFDDKPVSSDLVLETGEAKRRGNKIDYTPFRKNPKSSNTAFEDYYYVSLRKITVGGVKVKAPYKFLVTDSDGNGGTIVDSGSTFTFMESPVFEVVAKEFVKQIGGKYKRAADVENKSGLRPCFNITNDNNINLPQLVFHFKGGAKMVLPAADYFSLVEDSVACMTIVTGDRSGQGGGMGPAIILGNYQQQNFYIEYDLENERLGIRKQICK